jgi:hypothetical protein
MLQRKREVSEPLLVGCVCKAFATQQVLQLTLLLLQALQSGALPVSREQFAQQLLLRGFVAGQHALELLAQLGGPVSA